ncbi:MAG: Calx-beta domain-containing protein, partial [Pseudomonadales bacterium]
SSASAATVIIEDNDTIILPPEPPPPPPPEPPPTTPPIEPSQTVVPEISVAPTTASENSDLHFTLTLSEPTSLPVTVSYGTSDGTATMGQDYFAKSGMTSIQPGQTSATVRVILIDDNITETDELLTLKLDAPNNATLGTDAAQGAIIDDDITEVRLAAATASITEGEDAIFIASVSPALARDMKAPIAMTETGSFMQDNSPQWILVPAGKTAATLSIGTQDDDVSEPDGAITASLPTDMAPMTILIRSASVRVLDNDHDKDIGRNVNEMAMPYIAMAIADETSLAIRKRVQAAFADEQQSGLLVQGATPKQLFAKLVRRKPGRLAGEADTDANNIDVNKTDANNFTPFDSWQAEQKHREALWNHAAPEFNLGDFEFAMRTGDLGAQDASVEYAPTRQMALWGRGYHYNLSDVNTSLMKLGGKMSGAITGFDIGWPNFLAGLGLNMSDAELDFRQGDATGVHKTHVAGIRPYFGGQRPSGAHYWGMLGWDKGDIEVIADGDRNERYRRDVELQVLALGGQGPARSRHSVAGASSKVSYIAEGVFARMKETESVPGAKAVAANAGRIRLGIELDYVRPMTNGGKLSSKFELTARHDSGDALTGVGAELGGSLSVSMPDENLKLEISGRTLFAHVNMGVKEWGIAANLLWTARGDGSGLSLAFKPQWGATAKGSQQLWDGSLASHQSLEQAVGLNRGGVGGVGAGSAGLGYSLEVKYGIPVMNATETLVLFARNETENNGDNIGMGASLKIGDYLHIEYEAVMIRSNKIEHRPQIRYQRKH